MRRNILFIKGYLENGYLVMEFDNAAELSGADMPQPSEILSAVQKDGSTLQAVEIYETTWKWLDKRGCAILISP